MSCYKPKSVALIMLAIVAFCNHPHTFHTLPTFSVETVIEVEYRTCTVCVHIMTKYMTQGAGTGKDCRGVAAGGTFNWPGNPVAVTLLWLFICNSNSTG